MSTHWMGDIGDPVRRIEFEPFPETAPAEPAPVTAPEPEQEHAAGGIIPGRFWLQP